MNEPPPSAEAVLELDGLTVKLGRRTILDTLEASFSGRAIGLLGPNGAGKTTLLRTLLGFYPPSSGGARVFGRPLATEGKEIRSEIGYMPESDAYIANITAVHFVRLMAELSGLPPAAALERSHEALFYVGLGEARYRKVGTFSTGMKQMVKLAQALVHGPRLLMLDEPTNGLDPPARKRMIDLVCDIRDRGTSRIILSSHLLGDVETVCDEVLILRNGVIADSCDLESERRANKNFVEVDLEEPSDDFDRAVAALGCEIASLEPGRLKLVMPADVSTRELWIAADRIGVGIRRLDLKRDSLQDIFLRAMEGNHGGV